MARKEEFVVTYVSNGMNKTTQTTKLVAADKHEAKAKVEAGNNKVIAVVFQRAIFD